MSEDNIGCVINLIVAVVVLAISFGFVYLIGTSSLPDWVKFWLLSH